MFMANELPELIDGSDSNAIYDRTHIIKLTKKFRHSPDEIKNIAETVCTNKQLDGFITYLLKNATWIWNKQKLHVKIEPLDTKETWNTKGNRIKNFFMTYCQVEIGRVDQNIVFNKWMQFASMKGFEVGDKKKFLQIFSEICGNILSNTTVEGMNTMAFSGFIMKSDEDIKKNSQSTIKRILYKCRSCTIEYNTNEPYDRLVMFHKMFYPTHQLFKC